jgi:hypothetical protein
LTAAAAGTPPGAGGDEHRACPHCGRAVHQTTLGGLCPACLMRQALTAGMPSDGPSDGVAFTIGSPGSPGAGGTLISAFSPSASSASSASSAAAAAAAAAALPSSTWMLVTLIADDEEHVTYLAREQPSAQAGAQATADDSHLGTAPGAAPDIGAAAGPPPRARARAGSSPRLAQLLVRKQHVPAPELADARQQLQRRCDALRRLHHPTLAPVLDGGITEDGHAFLVTAFVMAAPLSDADADANADADADAGAGAGAGAGNDADASLDDKARPAGVNATRSLLAQAREGLQALHDAGLAHGRVRASTILVQPRGRRTAAGATAVVTGFAPLLPFPTLADAIADDLAQLQRLTSTLRV